MRKITHKCPKCGGVDLVMDATARWNDDFQKWEFSNTTDYVTCQDCSYEHYHNDFEVVL